VPSHPLDTPTLAGSIGRPVLVHTFSSLGEMVWSPAAKFSKKFSPEIGPRGSLLLATLVEQGMGAICLSDQITIRRLTRNFGAETIHQ
jgi:hypothetical protein